MSLFHGASGCAQHRTSLIELLEDGVRDDRTIEALDHLDRCRSCEAVVGDVFLVAAALRRLGREAAAVDPRPDAWERVVARIERSRDAARRATWQWRTRLGGMMASAFIVAVVVVPSIVGQGGRADVPRGSPPVEDSAGRAREQRAEVAFMRTLGAPGTSDEAPRADGSEPAGVLLNYPDGIRPNWKEVWPEPTARWPLTAS